METLKRDVGGSNRGAKACPEERQGLPEAFRRGNRVQGQPGTPKNGCKPEKMTEKQRHFGAALDRADCLIPAHAYLGTDECAFPLSEYLCRAAGGLFRARRPDAGGLAPADQAEPAAGDPSRPRSGPAQHIRGNRDPGRQARPRRRRPDRDGLCRPPVRSFRSATRRRPRHPARRGDRRRRRAP